MSTMNSIATGGGAKTAWFKDTEGNILAVSQRLDHRRHRPGSWPSGQRL
jgi:hypothetical protein